MTALYHLGTLRGFLLTQQNLPPEIEEAMQALHAALEQQPEPEAEEKPKKRRSKMSPEAREAARKRMKEYQARRRPDPLEVARKTVPGFNRDKMTLHGKPIKLVAVMKLCNRRLKAEGRDQLGPEGWRV